MASRQKLSQLVDSIPGYPLLRGSISSEGVVMSKLERQLVTMGPLSINTSDGIKLSFTDGWLLLRVSGTEPKIRVTAEAKGEARVHQLYDSAVKLIKDCMSKSGEK